MWKGETEADSTLGITPGTLESDVSEAKRHSRRRYKPLPKNATGQRRLLAWLWLRERRILNLGTAKAKRDLRKYGVRFSPKAFLDTGDVTPSQETTLAGQLRRLEGGVFILRRKSGATGRAYSNRVFLTPSGREHAEEVAMVGALEPVRAAREEATEDLAGVLLVGELQEELRRLHLKRGLAEEPEARAHFDALIRSTRELRDEGRELARRAIHTSGLMGGLPVSTSDYLLRAAVRLAELQGDT